MTNKPTPTNADSPSRQMSSAEPIMRVQGQVQSSVQKEEMTGTQQLLLQCARQREHGDVLMSWCESIEIMFMQ